MVGGCLRYSLLMMLQEDPWPANNVTRFLFFLLVLQWSKGVFENLVSYIGTALARDNTTIF